jgi:hypothetical protein
MRLLKSTPYHTFINSYPQKIDQLRTLVEQEQEIFETVGQFLQRILYLSLDQTTFSGQKLWADKSGTCKRAALDRQETHCDLPYSQPGRNWERSQDR